MDEIVKQALEKWPNVPDCYGWLRLDRRGQWWTRDQRVTHAGLIDFIGRNYTTDGSGRYFFQNGPQRVFVELDYTPWVYRETDGGLVTHTGLAARDLRAVVLDEEGCLLLWTELGPGVADDRDWNLWLTHLEDAAGQAPDLEQMMQGVGVRFRHAGRCLPVVRLASSDIPLQGGYVRQPVPPMPAHGGT